MAARCHDISRCRYDDYLIAAADFIFHAAAASTPPPMLAMIMPALAIRHCAFHACRRWR